MDRSSLPLDTACYLWIELHEFYVPDRNMETCVVVHRDGFVLDRNQAAKSRGVHPGLELKKAKAILQEATYLPWRAEEYYVQQAAWLDLCTLFSNTIEPADQHTAWVDLTLHPDPVGTAEELIRELSQHTQLPIQSGLAPTKWLGQLAAKYHDTGYSALRDPRRFVSGLHVRELLPIELDIRERLSFLGYAKIGQVAELPFEVLKEQFGAIAYVIHAAARGGHFEPVEAAYPPQSCLERFSFEGRADSTETIQNGLAEVARRIGLRLEHQNLEGTNLTATLEFEEDPPKAFKRTFSKPIRDARTALVGLCLLLEKELSHPITGVQVLVSELRKTRVAQGQFLVNQNRAPQRLDAAIQRAHTVYGDLSIRKGQEIRLPRRVLVLREWKHATGWY